MPFGDRIEDLERLDPSCALDVADDGPIDTFNIGRFLNRSDAKVGFDMGVAKAKLKAILDD